MRYVSRGIIIVAVIIVSVVAAGGVRVLGESPTVKPINDLPNPYVTTRDWAQLPAGLKFAAVVGAEQGPDGSIYVLHRCFEDSCAGRPEPPILKFDKSGKFLASWGVGMFVFPHGLHIDQEGNIWVADALAKDGIGHQVTKFSPDGKVLMKLGKAGVAGSGPYEFNEPTDITTTPGGEIFVSDGHHEGNQRIVKYSKDGKFILAWGKLGSAPGEFNEPHAITLDSRGRVFVADRSNNRIQIFDQQGHFLDQWKQFSRPSGLFITKDDMIYVADADSWGPDNPGWKKGIRIGSAKDGTVKYFIEDLESTTQVSSGPNAVSVDSDGNVYGAINRRHMIERHVLKKGTH